MNLQMTGSIEIVDTRLHDEFAIVDIEKLNVLVSSDLMRHCCGNIRVNTKRRVNHIGEV